MLLELQFELQFVLLELVLQFVLLELVLRFVLQLELELVLGFVLQFVGVTYQADTTGAGTTAPSNVRP